MPQLVKKRRSGWAVLAAGALVASLFAVGAAPAASAPVMAGDDNEAEPSNEAPFTACPDRSAAVADQGFTDLGSLDEAVPHINCLAYYEITMGRTADTFDPNSNVTRSEMALFLYRAADPMDVDLMGGDSDMMADYGDVAELGEERQAAIAALARNEILMGRSDMAFEPFADITRAEMAVALVALLDRVPGAPVHKDNDSDLYELGDSADTAVEPDDWFEDVRLTQPAHVDNAISAAYELGITTGVGDGSLFDPDGSIPRRDMAAFIMRAAAHSNLRPAGLTAQVHDDKITVSVRDAGFAPTVNQTVDVFRAAAADEDRAFTAAGKCSASRTHPFEGSPTACEIDGADPVTQTNGNVEVTLDGDVGDGQTVWIWHGEIGDKFDSDTTDFVKVSIMKGAAPRVDAETVEVTTDLAEVGDERVGRARFGSTVTVKIQQRGTDNAGDAADAAPDPTKDPVKYGVETEEIQDDPNSEGVFDDLDNGAEIRSDTFDVTIGADGSATFTVTAEDPDPDDPGDYRVVRYTVTTGDIGGDGTDDDPVTGIVAFADEDPKVEYVSVESNGSVVAPGVGGTAGNSVTVTVLDQYGDPVGNAGIVLLSSNPTNPNATPPDADGSTIRSRALNTGRSGKVRIGYSYSGGASQETLVAVWDATAGDTATTVDSAGAVDVGPGDKHGVTKVEWVLPYTAPVGALTDAPVLSIDADNDQIVVDPTGEPVDPTSINYDGNDFFTVVDGSSGTDVTTPSSITDFEEAVAKALAGAKGDDAANGDPTLTFSSYVHDEPSDITSFTLNIPEAS